MSLKKRTTVEKPHAIYQAGDWEWRVLKTYQNPRAESTNPSAVWHVAVKSPRTYGEFECGDSYVYDIVRTGASLVKCTQEWADAYKIPRVEGVITLDPVE